MSIKHSIYDTDPHFKIDPITRLMSTESQKVTLQQFDHNAERFTFEVPRLYEGHDLSLCDQVQVHYINIDAKTKKENTDVYDIDDIQLSPDSEDVVICSWLIKNTATQYAGTLAFLLKFRCLVDGKVTYEWNTAPYKNITISEGMNNGDAIIEEYSDILSAWEQKLMAAGGEGVNVVEVAETEALQNIETAKQAAVVEIENADRTLTSNALKGYKNGNGVVLTDISPLKHELKVKCNSYIFSDMRRTRGCPGEEQINADVKEVFTIHDNQLFGSWLETFKGVLCVGSPYNFVISRCTYSYPKAISVLAYDEADEVYVKCWESEEEERGKNAYLKENFGFTFDEVDIDCDDTIYFTVSTIAEAKLIKAGKNFAQINSVSAPFTDIVTIFEGEIAGDFVLSCDISTLGDFTNESAALFRCTLKDGTSFNSASIKYFTPVQISGVLTKVELVHWSYAKSGSVNNIQLEPGTTPTEFEPFKELKTHTINADGTVEGVTSLYPITTLMSDTEGVVLDVEYNRDINKAFAALEAALINNI